MYLGSLAPDFRQCISYIVCAVLLSTIVVVPLCAQRVDTLSAFNSESSYRWYRINRLDAQAARFEVKAAGTLREVRLLLAGDSNEGTARLRIFGYEGGSPAPFLERDQIEPITFRKTQPGLQWITVPLPRPVRLDHRQFFISIDQLSTGVVLVTDSDIKPVCCENQSEIWRYQCLKTNDGRWWTGQYGFAIEAVINYDHDPALTWLVDKTAELRILDTSAVVGGIAWADYNMDSRLDLLVNGRLYENLGESFVEVSESVGLQTLPMAGVFIDANNDTRPDILFIGSQDTSESDISRLFIGSNDGQFVEHRLNLSAVENPTSLSIADADLDGYLDVFIGQGRDDAGVALPNLLLLNDREGGFIDRSGLLSKERNKSSQGSQWVDLDGNGFLDLYVVNQGKNASELWRANGDGAFSLLYGSGTDAPDQLVSLNTLGGSWEDANADGKPDLLAPQHVSLQAISGEIESVQTLGLTNETPFDALDFRTEYAIEFSEKQGSGQWVDVDNDGRLDILLTSASPCRAANLYRQEPSGRFMPTSSEYGLLHIAAGPDAVWVDYDNDGKLDLATLVNGRFRLFKNTREETSSWVAFDVEGQDATGMKMELYKGEKKISREVTSGRGLLMQDPLRLHFGLGDVNAIDSVILHLPGGGEARFTDLSLNQINKLRLHEGIFTSGHLLSSISAYPNPFSEEVTIEFSLKEKSEVAIEVFDLEGNVIAQPLQGTRDAGTHTISWQAVDVRGDQLPQGIYIYRLQAGSDVYMGRVVHGR